MCTFVSLLALLCVLLVVRSDTELNVKVVASDREHNLTRYTGPHSIHHCSLHSTDKFLYNKIRDLVATNVKLINYNITFENYAINPLTVGIKWGYKANTWSRVSNQHGQTLLSLAFNFGVMSLMTLTFGIQKQDIQLVDSPGGCFGRLTERGKLDTVMHLMSRDFQDKAPNITLEGNEGICHQIIVDSYGVGKFESKCCMLDSVTGNFGCTTSLGNVWLHILYIILGTVRVSLLFLGPMLFASQIVNLGEVLVPYVVKLKEPLCKTVYLCRPGTAIDVTYKHVLDFSMVRKFRKFKESIRDMPLGEPIPIEIWQYDILVDYKQLLTENTVPVGLMDSLSKTIFQCTIRDISPFKGYCKSNMFRTCPTLPATPWFFCWEKVGRVLLLLLAPIALYIRIGFFYIFEADEIQKRKNAVAAVNLYQHYENNLIHYLTPSHPVFISIYVLYFVTAITLTYLSRRAGGTKGDRFNQIILGAFDDYDGFSYISSLRMVASNFVWPLKRYGIVGIPIALVYWPIVMPLSVIVYVAYCLPTIYLTIRMLLRSRCMPCETHNKNTTDEHGGYRMQKFVDKTLDWFDIDKLMSEQHASKSGAGSSSRNAGMRRKSSSWNKIQQMVVAVMCIVTLYGVLIVMSECLGFIIEMLIFTLMGVIANAGSMLKYCTLIFLVILYSYDTFNNVPKKYLKLNKALFSEVKSRIADLDKVTSLPSYLQENFGFKSCENSEQADYEQPDNISSEFPRQWFINDLVLFIDNDDMPRIPRELFDEVCGITVAGSPGPVYKGLMEATQEFLRIVMFLLLIFVVVLSFSAVYRVSSTNQTMATLAGGFLPFILRTFMQPAKPEIELGTVSFKSKLDEIIINFYQQWAIFDFPFKPPSDKLDEEASVVDDSAVADENCNNCSAIDQPVGALVQVQPKPPKLPSANHSESSPPIFKSIPGNDIAMEELTASGLNGAHPPIDTDVDILIHIPEYTSDGWLEEWSDISDYDEPADEHHLGTHVI